ncbi:acid protease [Lactifluus volemus]|nr:acid protease [Lactifluus volemus]
MSVSPLRFTSSVKVGDVTRAIVTSDTARARKFLAGTQPHGPIAHKTPELRRRRGVASKDSHSDSRGHAQVNLADDGKAVDDTIDATDAALIYTATVGVGSPPTDYVLIIDTGSSNTWVGANKKYSKTGTSKETSNDVSVSYGSGAFTGKECGHLLFSDLDQVTLSPSLTIKSQSIGVASSSRGFNDVDGILGIGPVDLTQGTIGGRTPVPTITDNLFQQGTITTESIGIFYQPSTSAGALANGELKFGGIDSSKIVGDVNYVPITSTSPASRYWGVDQTVTYGSSGETILGLTSGIVDTGTTLILLATDAFQTYQQATGATLDQTTGLLTITASQFENLQSLFFNIGGISYELTPNAQIWPRSLNAQINGDKDSIYLIVADLQSPSGQGLDFINGFSFLQRYYSVYDVTNSQVGLAATPFTNAETN